MQIKFLLGCTALLLGLSGPARADEATVRPEVGRPLQRHRS